MADGQSGGAAPLAGPPTNGQRSGGTPRRPSAAPAGSCRVPAGRRERRRRLQDAGVADQHVSQTTVCDICERRPRGAALEFRPGGVPASQSPAPFRVQMLDTHVVARSFTAARVHAVESRARPANATTRPSLARLRRRMVADSRAAPEVERREQVDLSVDGAGPAAETVSTRSRTIRSATLTSPFPDPAVSGAPGPAGRTPPAQHPLSSPSWISPRQPLPGGARRHRAAYADVPRPAPNGAGSLRCWRCRRGRRFP